MNPDTTQLDALLLNQDEKLTDLNQTAEANLVETSHVKEAIQDLEKVLDVIAVNTEPKEKSRESKEPVIIKLDGVNLLTLKGDKGNDGKDYILTDNDKKEIATKVKIPIPKDGKTPTKTELLTLIKPLIPKVKDGEDGKTPTKKELEEIIKPLIPEVKNGEDGKDGSPDTPQEVADKLNTLTKAVDWKVLKNVPDMARKTPGGGGGQDVSVSYEGTKLTGVLKSLEFVGGGVNVQQLSDGTIVVTVPTPSGASANIATEEVVATQDGDNINIDLSQLTHDYTAIMFVARNGQIQSPSTWSITNDILTLTEASASNSLLVQYTYV